MHVSPTSFPSAQPPPPDPRKPPRPPPLASHPPGLLPSQSAQASSTITCLVASWGRGSSTLSTSAWTLLQCYGRGLRLQEYSQAEAYHQGGCRGRALQDPVHPEHSPPITVRVPFVSSLLMVVLFIRDGTDRYDEWRFDSV
jgi:hypothetical protein